MHEENVDEKKPRFEQVAPGIYKYLNGQLYERPWVDGKRTMRKLGTKNKKLANEELVKRGGQGKKRAADPLCSEIIALYRKDGYLDANLQKRPKTTEDDEETHLGRLEQYWNPKRFSSVDGPMMDGYALWRKKLFGDGTKGDRMVDREMNTLNNAFVYAKRRGLIKYNPLADRPRYQPSAAVQHCREFMPADADELHEAARPLFENVKLRILTKSDTCSNPYRTPV